jgi:membrane associated rhomboid family serine protease
MIFPIGDEQVHGGHKPFITYLFIGINVLVFLLQVTLPPGQQQGFVETYGMIPAEISHGQDYFTLLTNMFLHGGWMHLIGNMLFLWVFADNIEAVIGPFKFILFYFGGGIFASLAHLVFNINSPIPAVGASGAISAVLGAYLVIFPASQVKVWVLYLFRSFIFRRFISWAFGPCSNLSTDLFPLFLHLPILQGWPGGPISAAFCLV